MPVCSPGDTRAVSEAEEPESFESMYSRAADDLASLPWAHLAPHPQLLDWLAQQCFDGQHVLIVACGFGDDAEELARRGARVTAFDASPSAIGQCRKRFPSSAVNYVVADLFALPESWRRRFDLVVEIHTVQSIAPDRQGQAITAIAGTVGPGGRLFVRCRLRDAGTESTGRPWALLPGDLSAYADAGLEVAEFADVAASPERWRHAIAVYMRP